ncbi:MAG TPA: aldo/keto reductase [Bacteroidales bacterium]|nr:aldo/keto reductase [Bacteroidales bacterium]
MKNINRRGFLRKGITGAAGIVALSPVLAAAAEVSEQHETIIYRTLGKTGMKIPVISFGVMRADNPNLCKAAYEKGIKLFDTANGYQNGNNEIMLGNLLKNYPRNSFYLATKVKPAGVDREGKPGSETTAEDFLEKFNTSLSRLQMDYVDILYVHDIRNPEMLEYKPIIITVKKLKKEGKVKFIGFSTHANEPIVIDAAAESDLWDVILTSYNFKQSYLNELHSAISKASKAGIGIVAMKTMAGGGFLDKEKTKPINSTAALKWALSNPDITTTIPGMTDFDQLDLNVKILADTSITDDEQKDLMIASSETGLYCTACAKCIPACPNNLPVPDLMRAYMYAYGYSNPAMAHTLLRELGTTDNPCKECDSCKVECTKNFNIKEKITDISRLVNVPADFLA